MGERALRKVIMLMGYQRSGSNVFFNSLASDPSLNSYNESMDNGFFCEWRLRGEEEVREVLAGFPGTVLLKPISEPTYRDVNGVFEEYSAYDLWVAWIYRDPVNVYHSWAVKWGSSVDQIVEEWLRSNERILQCLPKYSDRIVIVKYEDLVLSRKLFIQACDFLGVKGKYQFRKDSGNGRHSLSKELIKDIDERTAEILSRMDEHRSFTPSEGFLQRLMKR